VGVERANDLFRQKAVSHESEGTSKRLGAPWGDGGKNGLSREGRVGERRCEGVSGYCGGL